MHEQLKLLGLLELDEQRRPERHTGRSPDLIQRSTRSDAVGEVFDPQELLEAAQSGATRPPDPRLGFVEVIGGGVAIPFVQTDPGQREVGVGQPVMVGDAIRFGESQRGRCMGSGLRTPPGESERESMSTKREDPPQAVLGGRHVESGFECSGALGELTVVEMGHRSHGCGQELDAVASADAQEVGHDLGGPEKLAGFVGGAVHLAGREVVQHEARVERRGCRGFAGVEVVASSKSTIRLHRSPSVMPGELRGEEVDIERDRHVDVLGLGHRQPAGDRQVLLPFEEALAPLDDHLYHLRSVARGEQLLDGIGQVAAAEKTGRGSPAQPRFLVGFSGPQAIAQQVSKQVVIAKSFAVVLGLHQEE